jgi:exosortase/archaeosortase family protein
MSTAAYPAHPTRASLRAARTAPETAPTPTPSAGRLRIERSFRWLLAVVLAAVAAAAIAFEHALRTLESVIAAEILPYVFATGTKPAVSGDSPAIAFQGDGHWFALRITAECAIAFYVAAILALTAALLLLPRFPIGRLLIAGGVGVAGMVLLNQVRFIWLGYAFSFQSREVFDWVHIVGGSILMAVGMAATLLFFVLFVVRKPSTKG